MPVNNSEPFVPEKTSQLVLGDRTDNYVAKAILLEEAAPPSYLRATVNLAAVSLVLFMVWAYFATLDIVALAPGQIMPVESVKVVQHVDGGRIASINVRDGQLVKKDEVLLRLNDTEAAAEYQTLSAKYWGLFARVERIRALIGERQANFSSVPATYKDTILEQQHTLKTSREQIVQLKEEIKILKEVSKIRTELAEEKLATRVQALDAQRALSQAEAELLRFRRAQMDELNISSNEMAQTQEQLTKLKDRLDRVVVLSPDDGIVQDLKFRTVGGVIPPGAMLMNIVPVDSQMHAEVRVSPVDIGFVKKDQTARLKVSTFDFMRYGVIEGIVSMVSPNSVLDENQEPYFKVIITVPKDYVGNDTTKKIEPGMTVQADILTDRQSVMRYLLRPIYVAFNQGMRER